MKLLKWTHGIFSSECATFYNIKDILHAFESILREESVTWLHSPSENQKKTNLGDGSFFLTEKFEGDKKNLACCCWVVTN